MKRFKNHQAWYFLSFGAIVLAYGLIALAAMWSQSAYAESAKRIVAIDGSITEIVYELGLGERLVGRDITSTYPPEATQLPSVGYMRSLSAEGILSLTPDLVLATADAKPQAVLTRLKEAGVQVVVVDNAFSLAGVQAKIQQVAKALGVSEKGDALAKKVKTATEKAMKHAREAASEKGQSSALFVLNMRGGNMMVAGQNSRADTLFEMAQVANPAAKAFKGYKPLTAEAAIQYNPSYIVTMSHGLKAAGGKDSMLASPALKMTEAGRKDQLLVMDNSFLTFGPRLDQAITDLVKAVYGEPAS